MMFNDVFVTETDCIALYFFVLLGDQQITIAKFCKDIKRITQSVLLHSKSIINYYSKL